MVYTKPEEGLEVEFDRWYNDVHLPQVLTLDGFLSARRFRVADTDAPGPVGTLPFLAIYEIEAGRLVEARAALSNALAASKAAVAEGRTPVLAKTDALHEHRMVTWYEEIGPVSS